MSTFKVTVEQVTIHPHPNADKLELAQVGLNCAVVGKGQFETGDWAIYIPEAAILPPELIEELGLTGRLAGRDKNRVKAVRLRGEISQGIVCRPSVIDDLFGGKWDHIPMSPASGMREPIDFADVLGITKYVPEIPTQMSGKVYAADRLLRWPDIESIKRHPDIFEPGEPVSVTEKIHGTCFLLTWADLGGGPTDAHVAVSSKGYGGKGLAIQRDAGNLYWRAVNAYSLEAFADRASFVIGAPTVGLFGEVYGAGVQDLAYDANANKGAPGFALFDIAVDYGDGIQVFLDPETFQATVKRINQELSEEDVLDEGVNIAPVLYQGPYDEKTLLELAEGKTTLGGGNIREGVVVRPRKEARSAVTGSRKIGKIVGEGYLTRGGNVTEFE
jgi:RNA ligase (TIGR02306 family)